MRHVADRLRAALEEAIAQLVEQQRKDDGGRKAESQLQETDLQRVLERIQRHRIAEEFLEMLQPHERAAPNAAHDLEILEGHGQTIHRAVVEDQDEQEAGEQHQEQGSRGEDALPERFTLDLRHSDRSCPQGDAGHGHTSSLKLDPVEGANRSRGLTWNGRQHITASDPCQTHFRVKWITAWLDLGRS